MTDNQQNDYIELKSIISKLEEGKDWSTFKIYFKQIKSKFKDIIDNESDIKLKSSYNEKLGQINAFETKAKGLNIAQDLYEQSIKTKATKKSISKFESKFYEIKKHILCDINDFIDSIPNE